MVRLPLYFIVALFTIENIDLAVVSVQAFSPFTKITSRASPRGRSLCFSNNHHRWSRPPTSRSTTSSCSRPFRGRRAKRLLYHNDTAIAIAEATLPSTTLNDNNDVLLADVETTLEDIFERDTPARALDEFILKGVEDHMMDRTDHSSTTKTMSITTVDPAVTPSMTAEDVATIPSSGSDENKDVVATDDDVPTYKTLIKFASTSILIWLSEPLLSLVDTTVVGLTQGSKSVLQLASLGPATTLMDSAIYMTYFLAIATTNQIARRLSDTGSSAEKFRGLQRTTSHVMCMAFLMGLAVTCTVFKAGPGLMANMAGSTASPELLRYAIGYSRIRAIAAPAAVMGMVSQSFLLATMNTRTVAHSVLAASLINVVGDVLLRRQGVFGAAIATATAVSASSFILLSAVRRQLKTWRKQEVEASTQAASTDDAVVKAPIPFLSIPDGKSLFDLLRLSLPLAFNMWSKLISYSALTLRCTGCGMVALASHNIMLRVFWLFGCLSDCLGQTAQSFLPRTLYPKFNPSKFKATWKKLAGLAAGAATIGSLLSAGLFRFGAGLLAKDGAILHALQNNHMFLALSLVLHPFIVAKEGAVIARHDFMNLVMTYLVTLGVHFTVLSKANTLTAVWRALFIWQISRLVNFNIWKKRSPRFTSEAVQSINLGSGMEGTLRLANVTAG